MSKYFDEFFATKNHEKISRKSLLTKMACGGLFVFLNSSGPALA